MIFLVDHTAGIIEKKQVVKLDILFTLESYKIRARGNTILCFHDHDYCHEFGITVSELGPNPALKVLHSQHQSGELTLSSTTGLNLREVQRWHYAAVQFFIASENTVAVCDKEGARLYPIPELSSTALRTISPVWERPEEFSWCT